MTNPLFPGGAPVAVTVSCRLGGGRARRHPITIAIDWSVETPHDLELERIGRALGGTATCVDLVDRVVPAVHAEWSHWRRLVPPDLGIAANGRWAPAHPIAGCSCSTGWPDAHQAAAHLRGHRHWARHYGIAEGDVRKLAEAIAAATGTLFDPDLPAPRVWQPSAAVYDRSDLTWLWEAGINPVLVDHIHAKLGLSWPMSRTAYLHIAARGVDLGWLAPFAKDGPDAVAWAASSFGGHDRSHPDDRLGWYRTGINWRLINTLLPGPYSLDDVMALARANGSTPNATARVFAEWLSAGCQPTLDQLLQVCRLVPHGRQGPATKAVDALVQVASHSSPAMTRTEVALLLVAAGTPTTAAALIRRGTRTLDDLDTGCDLRTRDSPYRTTRGR